MKKVLIVDDEERIRKIYSNLLISENFEVFEASNANEANKVLGKEDIDLILLDIKMKEIDGTELYKVMHLFYWKTKVIVASVYSLYEQKQMIPDADGYYDKSQGTGILLELVNKISKE